MIAAPRNRWWIVFASMIAMLAGPGPLLGYTFGLFLDPIARDLGWTRADVAVAYSCSALGTAVAVPFVGRLIDRVGNRRFALVAVWISSGAIASLAWLPRSAPLVYLWFFAVGVAITTFGPVVFARLICLWFDTRRGLALGLTLVGTGIGTAIVPVLGHWLLENGGWRQTYATLAALSFALALPAVIFGSHEPKDQPTGSAGKASQPATHGLTKSEAFKRKEFWLLLVSILINSAGVSGTTVHLMPALTDHGIASGDAAWIASVLGIALIVGRIGSGYLADRLFAPRVLAAVFIIAGVGLLLLANASTPPLLVLAVACIGLGAGAELDLLSFLVSRYFGLRSFAEIYGYIFMGYILGTASGAALIGASFAQTGSYHAGLTIFAGLMVLSALVLLRFRPYPNFAVIAPDALWAPAARPAA